MSNPTQSASAPNQLPFPVEERPVVQLIDSCAVTTSVEVARCFKKRHSDVLRRIEKLDCSSEFNERNFALVDYCDDKGESRPMYRITRDGFVFLAMGFTGARAATFKEAYINAFNEMEKKLREESKAQGGTLPAPAQSLTPELLKFIEGRSIEVAIQAKEKATSSLTKMALQELQRQTPEEVVEQMSGRPGLTHPCVLLYCEFDYLYQLVKFLPEQCKQLQGVLNQAQA